MKKAFSTLDVNTHEFTLECLTDIYENIMNLDLRQRKLLAKVNRGNFMNKVKFVAVLGVLGYMYYILGYRIEMVENEVKVLKKEKETEDIE